MKNPNFSTCCGRSASDEAGLLAFVPVEKLERLEVAEKLEAGALPFGQRVEVRAGLFTCSDQVASGALLLDQEDAGPEEIDVAGGVVEPLDAFLVPRHGARRRLAEDLEELVVEALGLALLVRGVGPFTGEVRRLAFGSRSTKASSAAVSRYGSIQEAQDRDHAAEDRKCLRQHRTGETPRQPGLKGRQIPPLHVTQMVEIGASGQLAAVVGGGILSDIDHGDSKRLVRAGGGQHPHGRVGVHRRQGITARRDPAERNHPVGRRVKPCGSSTSFRPFR